MPADGHLKDPIHFSRATAEGAGELCGMQAQRLTQMDTLRAVAILAVIGIHVSSGPIADLGVGSPAGFTALAVNQVARFGVPIFLIVSGLGLGRSRRPEDTFRTFALRRGSRVLPAYLLWSAIYMMADAAYYGAPPSVVTIAKNLALGISSYHLYFVVVILQMYVMYWFLRGWLHTHAGLATCVAITVLSQVTFPFIASQTGDSAIISALLQSAANPLRWLAYFAFGVWLAPRVGAFTAQAERNHRCWVLMAVIGAGTVLVDSASAVPQGVPIAQATTSMRPLVIAYSLAVMISGWGLKARGGFLTATIRRLSGASFLIYLAHPLFLQAFWAASRFANASPDPIGGLLESGLVCLSASLVLSVVFAAASRLAAGHLPWISKWSDLTQGQRT